MRLNSQKKTIALFTSLVPASLLSAYAYAEPDTAPALEEIVVTAQKRSESSKDVPIAISVLSSEHLANAGITGTTGLSEAIPTLSFTATGNVTQPILRGVGTNNVSPGDEANVAIYVDGVYHSSPVGNLFSFNNIAQIEVDKGPQGTLFGRNATAGVIQITTKDPQQTPSADVSIGYSNYSTIDGSLYATTGITKALAANISFYVHDQRDGWGRNIATGNDVFLGQEYAARSKWLLTIDENTTVKLIGDFDRNVSDFNTSFNTGGHPASLGFNITPTPQQLALAQAPRGFYGANSNLKNFTQVNQSGVSVDIAHTMPWARISSITAYRNTKAYGLLDQDITQIQEFSVQLPQFDRTFTQEFQLTSADSSPIKWVGGLFYYANRAGYTDGRIYKNTLAGPLVDINALQNSKSYAGYGQATAPIATDTHLTLGARYTVDQRKMIDSQTLDLGQIIGAPVGAVLICATETAGCPVTASKRYDKVTYRASLDHKFGDTLVYAEYSTGFKSGLFNLIGPITPAGQARAGQVEEVQPETLNAYEVGTKSELWDRRLRLNASGYFYQFSDIQFGTIVSGNSILVNAAKAHIKGIDFDLDVVPLNNLTLQLAATVLDAKYTSFPDAYLSPLTPGGGVGQVLGSATGNHIPQAPKFVANLGGEYEIPTTQGDFFINANYYFNNGFYWGADNRLSEPSYRVVNTSVKWVSPSKTWDVKIWGKNIFGQKYWSLAVPVAPFGDQYSPAAPATYGVTFSAHFR